VVLLGILNQTKTKTRLSSFMVFLATAKRCLYFDNFCFLLFIHAKEEISKTKRIPGRPTTCSWDGKIITPFGQKGGGYLGLTPKPKESCIFLSSTILKKNSSLKN